MRSDNWQRWARGSVWVLLVPFAVWSVMAILLGGTGSAGIGLMRWAVALVFASAVIATAARMGSARGLGVAALLGLLVLGWFLTLRPSNERVWAPIQGRMARAEVDGTAVTIHNIRDTEYRAFRDLGM